MKKPSPNRAIAGRAGTRRATTKIAAITRMRAAAANATARKTSSPEMSRRWRLVATSGAGATRSALPLPIRSLGRDLEERAPPGGDAFQGGDVVRHHIAGELRVVKIHGVLLAVVDQPVQQVDRRRPLGLVRLVGVYHQPAIAADRGAVLTGRVDNGEVGGRCAEVLTGGRRRPGRAGKHEVAVRILQLGLRHLGLQHVGELHVADRTGRLRDPGRYTRIARRTIANRPVHGFAGTPGLRLPSGTDVGEVVREDIRRSAAVRAVDDPNVLVGQVETTVV